MQNPRNPIWENHVMWTDPYNTSQGERFFLHDFFSKFYLFHKKNGFKILFGLYSLNFLLLIY